MFANDDNYTNPDYSKKNQLGQTPKNPNAVDIVGQMNVIRIIIIAVFVFGFIQNHEVFDGFGKMLDQIFGEETAQEVETDEDFEYDSDLKFLERYLNSTYNETCYATSKNTFSCLKTGDNSVYAYIVEHDDGGISGKDNYYFEFYRSQIESMFWADVLSTIKDSSAEVELADAPDVTTSQMEKPKIAEFLANYDGQLAFTVHIKDKSTLSQEAVNSLLLRARVHFKNYTAAFVLDGEDEDAKPEELFTITYKNGQAEMSYYEF